ncbi:MAG: ribonuclease J, partial [Pseudomonadota bacterium]
SEVVVKNKHHCSLLEKYKSKLIFIPLGGSNEIGMNMNLYHIDGKWIMVDCGAGFVDSNNLGVQVVVPNINFINKYIGDDLQAIIITHMHQDHIGAYSYLTKWLKCPVYTTEFTANFLRSKLNDPYHRDQDPEILERELNNIHVLKTNSIVQIAGFSIRLIELNHSAPEMQALQIETREGNIFHSGDWKRDKNPVLGRIQDINVLKDLGRKGVLALVCDSTNIFSRQESGSEGDLQISLEKIVARCKQRVVITTFASNLARIYSIAMVAKRLGRKIVLAGRSFSVVVQAALLTKSLVLSDGSTKEHPFKDIEFFAETDMKQFAPDELLIVATGCQGEELAVMSKVAMKKHANIVLDKGDTVIFSSKTIPGNEKKVGKLQNMLVSNKINVITDKDHFSHVSGHPGRGDLKYMYDCIKPEVAVPVHGEAIHLVAHAKYARELGVPHSIVPRNGSMILLEKGGGSRQLRLVENGYYGVDGNRLIDLQSFVMKLRRKMSFGVLLVTLVYDNGHLIKDPHVHFIGCFAATEVEIMYKVKDAIANLRDKLKYPDTLTEEKILSLLATVVGKIILGYIGKIPLIRLNIIK